MTNFEKNIYNSFLVASRKAKNQPFNVRKNFMGFEQTEDYFYIKRLSNLFGKFPDVTIDIYFKAPYDIYPDEKYFDLKFYASPKGLKSYSLYIKKLKLQSPDDPEQLEFIRKSLKVIGLYCVENNIHLNNYLTHKIYHTYTWLEHIAKGKVSIYTLLEFPQLYDIISTLQKDEIELFLGDVFKNYSSLKTQYQNSKEARFLVKRGIEKINDYVESQIKK